MSGTSTTKGLLRHLGGMPVLAGIPLPYYDGHVWFVDHTHGSDSYDGHSLKTAKVTIQAAITAAKAGDVILVQPGDIAITGTDPHSYTENLVIPNTHPFLSIIGIDRGRTQGGLPQLKVGATTTQALLTIRAPGCLIHGIGFNGDGATDGGILLDDNGTTKVAFGTTIQHCHFKNCVGTTATNAQTGGAIQWSSDGGAWQTRIKECRFYKNVGDIVMKGTGQAVPQDVIIEDNVFSGPPANVDCNITVMIDGILGLILNHNVFVELPALSSGTTTRYIDLAVGTTGIVSNNVFGCTGLTFRTTTMGSGGRIPAAVKFVNNWQEDGATPIVKTAA